MSMTITRAHLDAARAAGACRVSAAWVGMTLTEAYAAGINLLWVAIEMHTLSDAERDALQALTGARSWWRGDVRDREDGPAIEWPNGDRAWYRNGKRVKGE